MRMFLSRAITVAVLVGTMLLSACSEGEPSARPSPTEPDSPAMTEPTATATPGDAGSTAAADCSAAELDIEIPPFEDIDEPASETARLLLDAALHCDEQVLFTVADESGTQLTFGALEPGQMFGLPERDTPYYAILAKLLGRTGPAQITTDEGTIWAWPAAFANPDVDSNWQRLVDADLYTQEEVEEMRKLDGYLGWRIGIATDGTWQYFVAGD